MDRANNRKNKPLVIISTLLIMYVITGLALLALALLTAIIVRCVLVARRAKSPLESYICVGIAGMMASQILINVGVCLGLVPVIGLTLPFFSYGGSSIVTLFLAMGMVSGIHKRTAPEWLR